jgi:hypothetical protein
LGIIVVGIDRRIRNPVTFGILHKTVKFIHKQEHGVLLKIRMEEFQEGFPPLRVTMPGRRAAALRADRASTALLTVGGAAAAAALAAACTDTTAAAAGVVLVVAAAAVAAAPLRSVAPGAIVAAEDAAHQLGQALQSDNPNPFTAALAPSVAIAVSALVALGGVSRTTSGLICSLANMIAIGYRRVGDEPASAAHVALAADAAALFPDAVSMELAANCFDEHGRSLVKTGQVDDGAGWLARAHHLHKQLPPSVGFACHIAAACVVRFLCGHPARAIRTMKRVVGNPTLAALDAEVNGEWSLITVLASMLFLSGGAQEAMRVAEPVAAVPPRRISSPAVHLLSIRATNDVLLEREAAMHALAVARLSSELAADTEEHHAPLRHRIDVVLSAAVSRGHFSSAACAATLREYVSGEARSFLRLWPGAGPRDPPLPDPFVGVINDDALPNIAETRECAQCGRRGEKLHRCKECRSVWYCSTECQQAHWRAGSGGHRKPCRCNSVAVIGIAGASAAALLVHVPGVRVEAHSLSTVALNGTLGRVVGAQGDRVRVNFGDGAGIKALRPWNLRLATDENKTNAGARPSPDNG